MDNNKCYTVTEIKYKLQKGFFDIHLHIEMYLNEERRPILR